MQDWFSNYKLSAAMIIVPYPAAYCGTRQLVE